MTNTMPISPVVNQGRHANPEWRAYMAQAQQAVDLLDTLLSGAGGATGTDQLRERLASLRARIDGLPALARGHKRLVATRVVNERDGTSATGEWSHNLGTTDIFFFGSIPGAGTLGRVRNVDSDEGRIQFTDDDVAPIPANAQLAVIGVIGG